MSRRSALVTAGAVSGGLYLVGFIALGTPPDATDAPATVLQWFRDHDDAARTYAWTASLGMLAFAVLAALIHEVLPRPQATVFLLGAAAFIVETTIQAWIWAGLALHPATLAPETARALLDVALFWGPLLTGATCMMIGAVTVLGLRADPLIPRWLTVLGAIAFAEQAIETITVFGTSG